MKGLLYALGGVLVIGLAGGCASKPSYNIAIPVATSQILDEVKMGDERFEIRYKTDARGQRLFRTVPSDGAYTGSDRESYESIKEVAVQRMIRKAIDEVNGVFIAAKTEVTQVALSRGETHSAYEDFKDQTVSKVAGFAKVEGAPHCARQSLDGGATRVSCQGNVRVPEVDVVKTAF